MMRLHKKSLYLAMGLFVVVAAAGAFVSSNQPATCHLSGGCDSCSPPPGTCPGCPGAVTCSDAKAQTPMINSRACNGCGRCVRIAPKTFALTPDGRKAKVINPTGDKPEVLSTAAKACGPGAITFR